MLKNYLGIIATIKRLPKCVCVLIIARGGNKLKNGALLCIKYFL